MSEIYFDNSATTRPSKAVVDIMLKTLTSDYGNPSSLHRKGMEAEQYVRHAAEQIASVMKVSPGEIFFTSGGTEANNLALFGGAEAMKRRGNRILTTRMEHPAVAEPLKALADRGFVVETIPVDPEGRVDPEACAEILDDDVILVTTMFVNNEIGAVVPVAEIAEAVHRKAPHALFHVDAIQAFGKYRILPRRMGIDLLSVSGHKLHGPKGTGFLYVRSGVRLVPLLRGGGQMGGLRSGTENVPGIAGLGVAAEEAYRDLEQKTEHLYALRARLIKGLSAMEDVVIHGMPGREGAPHIVSASFLGVGSEVLLHALEDRGIYVSAGSACSTHKRHASPTMSAIGAPAEEVSSAVRFSFSEENTEEEIGEALSALRALLPVLRRYRAK